MSPNHIIHLCITHRASQDANITNRKLQDSKENHKYDYNNIHSVLHIRISSKIWTPDSITCHYLYILLWYMMTVIPLKHSFVTGCMLGWIYASLLSYIYMSDEYKNVCICALKCDWHGHSSFIQYTARIWPLYSPCGLHIRIQVIRQYFL